MRYLPWAVALLAGVLAGVATCAGFVVRSYRLALAGVAATLATAALGASVASVWTARGYPDASFAMFFIGLAALAGGYALATELMPVVARRRSPAPVLGPVAPGDAIGVLLLADAEAEIYRARDVMADLETFERADVHLPPVIARPFVYASERARYRAAEGSPARRAVRAIGSALSARLGGAAVSVPVEIAFCGGEPSAAQAVAQMAARTGRRIVVVALTVAWTRYFDAAAGEVHALDPSRSRLSVETTEPLWASHALAAQAAERALAAFGDDETADGVVLVAHGNPWQFDRIFPAAMEQTTFLSQRIRAELIEAGMPAERVRQAWLEWEEPEVREAVRHLAALGADRVAVLPVDLLYDSLATVVDLPMAAERAASESDVRVAFVSPLDDDPALVTALADAIAEAARRLPPADRTAAV